MVTKVYEGNKLVGWDCICHSCSQPFYLRCVPVYLGEPNTEDKVTYDKKVMPMARCHECFKTEVIPNLTQEEHKANQMKKAESLYS